MHHNALIFAIFLIFGGAAILSTLALYTRQSMMVAYILLGIVLGPYGFKLVSDSTLVNNVGDVGIIFLLFLLGLHLPPQKFGQMLRQISWVGVISSLAFAAIGYSVGWLFGYNSTSCMVLAASVMFSSTIIGIKLLPTTILHHRHIGELMISVLLFQDMLAIIVLLFLHSASSGGVGVHDVFILFGGMIALVGVAFAVERLILVPLLARFDRIREYIFMLAIAWCLALAQLAGLLGLSYEVGAFIAGVLLASSPISLYIAEALKPLRDFFLVLFFFAVGAGFNLNFLHQVFIPAVILAVLIVVLKPLIYRYLLQSISESSKVSWEVGFRLGQASEFSLIVAAAALQVGIINEQVAYLIQATTILTFVVSCYFVVIKYPTPVALTRKLRTD
jgi:Kef-type K+ transport system membrane component KefB